MVVPYVNLDLLYDPNIHPTIDSINPRRPTGQDGCQYLVSAAAALPQHLFDIVSPQRYQPELFDCRL